MGFAPSSAQVLESAHIGDGTLGTYHAPAAVEVISAAWFGPLSAIQGAYDPAADGWLLIGTFPDSVFRAATVADAWVTRLNAEILPGSPAAVRVYEVTDELSDRATQAVHVVGKSDRGEPLSKRSWVHKIETATCLRVRVPADNDDRDAVGRLAQRIADYARTCRPLCVIEGHGVTLEGTAQVLWIPKDLEQYGVYDSVVIHTWRVEVPIVAVVFPSSSSESSESP